MLAKDIYSFFYNGIKVYDAHEKDSITRLILDKIYHCSDIDLIVNKDFHFDTTQAREMISRLNTYEPVQYILGACEFLGLHLEVNSSVLIPRQETQEMVYYICQKYDLNNKKVLDLCCGSGCIGIYLKKTFHASYVTSVDITNEALIVAQKNANKNNVKVDFIQCDIFSEDILKLHDFDVVISNPPYICEKEKKDMPKNVIDFEPHEALFVPDDDPMIFYKRIFYIIQYICKKKHIIFCEINEKYKKYFDDAFNFIHYNMYKDISEKYRYIEIINI